jgi:hypothetical protein
MNRKVTTAVGGIALSLGFACQAAPPNAREHRAEMRQHIDEDLARLRALDIIDVRQLVMKLPAEATACYGQPCTEAGAAALDSELARQSTRLHKLVAVAESVKEQRDVPEHGSSDERQAADALGKLAIVEVRGLLLTRPSNDHSPYGGMGTLEALNRRRVSVAFAIAEAAKKAGL